MDTQKELIGVLQSTFPLLENSTILSEEELVQLIANQVFKWVSADPEHLFRVLYQLDINEQKVRTLLAHQNKDLATINIQIAQLIIDRQKQKIETRKRYSPPKGEGDGWFS